MARKRKTAPEQRRTAALPADPAAAPAAVPAAPPPVAASGVPAESTHDDWTLPILAVTIFLAPAAGVPHEEMLQDTLKSIIVSMGALGAALLFFMQHAKRSEPLRWHGLMWLPLALMLYALGSMAWSHAFLGGVEAVRWFVFSLVLWLALNTFNRERLHWLAWAVHAGAVVAGLWAALQFWADLGIFPQGPNPASTFVNRNFYAEFAVCSLPFAWLLLASARHAQVAIVLAFTSGFLVTTILMTGTRSALIALWLQLLVVLPLVAWRCRQQLAWRQWSVGLRIGVAAVLAGTVLALGLIPSGNPKILEEQRGTNAIERGIKRTQSIGPADHSLNVRMVMWKATLNILEARPLTGVGAGAWESEIPLYQAEGSQLETDYYVHNEFLQLVAEYGAVGWVFLVLLLGYLIAAGWRAWRGDTPDEQAERPWRAVVLTSLLALLVVSNIGFPWRLASTGALFALCLGVLAASDARLGYRGKALASALRWNPVAARSAIAATVVCIALALFITQQAAESERKIVSATKMALTISASGRPNDPRWAPAKQEMLRQVREGVAINPHYRKITPMVADELAKWGDWANATWIWDSVLDSRPNVVAIISNAARGYSTLGQPQKAMAYLERAKRIQPRAPSVRSLEVILLSRAGQEAKALQLAREALAQGIVDYDLVNALFILAWRSKDFALAEKAMQIRMTQYPDSRARGHIQLGAMYGVDMKQPERALAQFRAGLAMVRGEDRAALMQLVPPAFRPQLAPEASAPAAGTQTSASSR